jgi:hypothetical protein
VSAYLTSNDTISALVTYWSASASHKNYTTPTDALCRAFAMAKRAEGGNPEAYPLDWASKEASKAVARYGSVEAAAFALLTLENVKSLLARYPGDDDMWEAAKGYRFKRSAQVMRWIQGHSGPRGHGFIVGMVRGFSYQACEHESWEHSPAFQLCEQIKAYLLNDLESRDCPDGGMWACYEEPASVGAVPISLSSLLKA